MDDRGPGRALSEDRRLPRAEPSGTHLLVGHMEEESAEEVREGGQRQENKGGGGGPWGRHAGALGEQGSPRRERQTRPGTCPWSDDTKLSGNPRKGQRNTPEWAQGQVSKEKP